ncbi:MAG: M23 family metallopeptidase [Syntrophaceticus sp.]|nr:M23 family metallopeptidase [Syntrophaceticus sp.]
MQLKTVLICCLVACLGAASPLHQAGYLGEDSVAPCWKEATATREIAQQGETGITYTVQPGDTLWSISRQYRVDVNELAATNGIKDDLIMPGQVLALSAEAKSPLARGTGGIIHQVSRGDTLWSLARRYQVSVGQLMEANQISDPNVISDGQNLIVSTGTDQVQPVMKQQPERNFSWPLAGRITSRYGTRGGGFHHGLDIAGDMGDVIKATGSGRVEAAEWRPLYGETVILDHGDGYQTLYAHTSEYLVEPGDFVEDGQGIARVGSTGRSTGPHLHFEIRFSNQTIDPESKLE